MCVCVYILLLVVVDMHSLPPRLPAPGPPPFLPSSDFQAADPVEESFFDVSTQQCSVPHPLFLSLFSFLCLSACLPVCLSFFLDSWLLLLRVPLFIPFFFVVLFLSPLSAFLFIICVLPIISVQILTTLRNRTENKTTATATTTTAAAAAAAKKHCCR